MARPRILPEIFVQRERPPGPARGPEAILTRRDTIQAVIFDIGRVLVDVDEAAGFYGLLRREGVPGAERWLDRVERAPLLRELGLGRATGPDLHVAVREDTGLDLGYAEFESLWCDVLRSLPHGEPLLRAVAETCRVGLLSNTNALHWRHMRVRFPWLRAVRCPTLSFEVGRLKPDPEIYRIAARDVEAPPERCLFVDDLAANVEGARTVGMQALQFTGVDAITAALRERGVLSGELGLPA